MTERLQKLLRQKALIQEHLVWIDREITDESGTVPPLPNTIKPAPSATASDTASAAEKILGQYNKDTNVVKTDARRGCLIMFFIGFAVFILAIAIGYSMYARHLGRWR